jgi:hypothetical protein
MTCANCGHPKDSHGKKLNYPLCPVELIDGECTYPVVPPRGRALRANQEKMKALANYIVARSMRGYKHRLFGRGPNECELGEAKNNAEIAYLTTIHNLGSRICGCLKYVPKEEAREEDKAASTR